MLKRDIIDNLYTKAVRRYKAEIPTLEFTDAFADRLWFSIKGVLDREGIDAAKAYVNSAKIIKDIRP